MDGDAPIDHALLLSQDVVDQVHEVETLDVSLPRLVPEVALVDDVFFVLL